MNNIYDKLGLLLQALSLQILFQDYNNKDLMQELQKQDKEYSKLVKKYEKLAAEVEQLESEFSHAGDDVDKIQTITFKLGRRVVEMRRLLQEMEKYHQRQNQNIYTSSLGHTR